MNYLALLFAGGYAALLVAVAMAGRAVRRHL
jgi:hypothetical protein